MSRFIIEFITNYSLKETGNGHVTTMYHRCRFFTSLFDESFSLFFDTEITRVAHLIWPLFLANLSFPVFWWNVFEKNWHRIERTHQFSINNFHFDWFNGIKMTFIECVNNVWRCSDQKTYKYARCMMQRYLYGSAKGSKKRGITRRDWQEIKCYTEWLGDSLLST